jgi:hypothetical protein
MLAALIAITVVALGASGNGYTSPIPQATILTATLGQTVPLGDLKIKIEDLRAATSADNPHHLPVSEDQNLIVMHAVLSNSVLPSFSGVIAYRLEDKKGYGPRTWERLDVQQRTTVHLHGLFAVDKDYVPTLLLVECSSCSASHYIAVQFTIPAPSPLPSPSPSSP